MLPYRRSQSESPQILIVDGLWGTGKSLLAPLVSTFEGVGPFRIDPTIEVLTTMLGRKSFDLNTYRFLVLNRVIENHYNNGIGREINLRPKDDSSFWRTVGKFEVLRRVFSDGLNGESYPGPVSTQTYFQMTHLLTASIEEVFLAFPRDVHILNIQRNPVFLVKHWSDYLSQFDRPRELTVSLSLNDQKVPFFAEQWAEEWLAATNFDRATLAIARCSLAEIQALEELSPGISGSSSAKTVYFSDLVRAPQAVSEAIGSFLRKSPGRATMEYVRKIGKSNKHKRSGFEITPRPELQIQAKLSELAWIRSRSSSAVFEEFEHSVAIFEEHEEAEGLSKLVG